MRCGPGNIVVFWFPNDPDKSYVKRVIGLPGENVEVRNGKVFINGVEIVTTDIQASNGIIHAISAVILPPQ